jgi:hypothetical protein
MNERQNTQIKDTLRQRKPSKGKQEHMTTGKNKQCLSVL